MRKFEDSEAVAWDRYVAAFIGVHPLCDDGRQHVMNDFPPYAAQYADAQILERRKRFTEAGIRLEITEAQRCQVRIEQDLGDLFGWSNLIAP